MSEDLIRDIIIEGAAQATALGLKDLVKAGAKHGVATLRDANKDYVRPFLDKAIHYTDSSNYDLPWYFPNSAAVRLGLNAVNAPLRVLRYIDTPRKYPAHSTPYSALPNLARRGSYGSGSFHRSSFSRRYFKRVHRKSRKPRRKPKKKGRRPRRSKRYYR